MEPLTNSPTDGKNVFLNEFIDWLDTWENIDCKKRRINQRNSRGSKANYLLFARITKLLRKGVGITTHITRRDSD